MIHSKANWVAALFVVLTLMICQLFLGISVPSLNGNSNVAYALDCENNPNYNAECLKKNPIIKNILQPALNFVSVIFGLVVFIMIIVAGIQYMTAGDNSNQISQAKDRIKNSLFALAVFAVMYSFLQWLIPGGIF